MDKNHFLYAKLGTIDTPKRILSLDGGGIRGIITLQYLKKIETLLRDRYQKPDFVLADYFDFIGGTSTGSIIATALSLGHDVDYITKQYEALGTKVFPASGLTKLLNFCRFGVLFNKKQLLIELNAIFREERLDSEKVKTGLGIVAKRADKSSTWLFYNHPDQKYYGHNRDILLKNAVRASTAAPIVFLPEKLKIKDTPLEKEKIKTGWFEDGGVSMHNNPTLLLFFTAILRGDESDGRNGFGFEWAKGAEKLMIVSIGTGFWRNERSLKSLKSYNPFLKLKVLLGVLMDDSSLLTEVFMQLMAKNSPTARKIDSMYGILKNETLVAEPLFHYLRYNLDIEQETLKNEDGSSFSDESIESLRDMTIAKNIPILGKLSKKAAENAVDATHFPPCFDIF